MLTFKFISIPILLILFSSCHSENEGSLPVSLSPDIRNNLSSLRSIKVQPLNSNLKYGAVRDTDKNSYATIQIGGQTWMAENLRVSRYNDGTPISNVVDPGTWSSLVTSAYTLYNNDKNLGSTYGRLYNWYAVTDTRGLCPSGWHLPSDNEWTKLSDYLGDVQLAGGKMKTTSTGFWLSQVAGVTNESGFSAIAAGSIGCNGQFYNLGTSGYWWTSTSSTLGEAWSRNLNYDTTPLDRSVLCKQNGFSVRCIKN